MGNQDNAYKLLFSHAEMVEQLLHGFVHEDWIGQVDFSTLEKRSGSYVADDLRDRHDDIIWRVRFKDQWLYVYLLIEFQSEVDPFMAVRIMAYLGLLYQDLARTGEVPRGGLFPPVLPLVLYNGKTRWNAGTNVADLIAPGPGKLHDYRPHLKYLLIDEGAVPPEEMASRNLVASLFALEQCRTPKQIKDALECLIHWWQDPAQSSLRRSFVIWIGRVLLPGKIPGHQFPNFHELQEVPPMLEETVKEWVEEWKAQGLKEGRQEGMKEGLRITARALLKRGETPAEIAEITGLTIEEIEALATPPTCVSETPPNFTTKS
jgi:hypothetical protein